MHADVEAYVAACPIWQSIKYHTAAKAGTATAPTTHQGEVHMLHHGLCFLVTTM